MDIMDMDGHVIIIMADMDVDFLMERDRPILPELSVLPREGLRLIQMLIPTTMVTPHKIHINHFHIIHYLKGKDQLEDPLPILSALSRLQREAEDATVFYPY